MSIDVELRAEILRLYHVEKWPVGTIALQFRVHHSTISRVVKGEGGQRSPKPRRRKVDAFLPFMEEMLGKYPRLTAARLLVMVKERGYVGQPSYFRALVTQLRGPRRAEPFQRLHTLIGEQAQVDWAHFGHLQIGRAARPLMAFVLVLSYSRAIFVHFFLAQGLSNFLHGHELAFSHFGGLVRVCLYDNLRSVVLERVGKAIRFNSQFMAFAAHYRIEPRPVGVARGNEKGRVERAIRYLRDNFFAARRYKDLDDLNRQVLSWCQSAALARRWPDDERRSVGEVLTEERNKLMPLPADSYPCDERCEVDIGKTPYARFDLNDYSVPSQFVQRTLVLVASQDTVRILHGQEVVATHPRSYDRDALVEQPGHSAELEELKHAAGQHRRAHVLTNAAPSSERLLEAIAERGLPLGRVTNELTELLRTYGAAALEVAVAEVLAQHTPHMHAVRQVLERQRHEGALPLTLPLQLPNDPRVQNMVLSPRSLNVYDQLQGKKNDK